jgi:hypothetical protein
VTAAYQFRLPPAGFIALEKRRSQGGSAANTVKSRAETLLRQPDALSDGVEIARFTAM